MGHITWEPSSGGKIPKSAILAGYDLGQKKIYVARGMFKGNLIPGKLVDGFNCVAIGHEGKEIGLSDYEVLVGSSEDCKWVLVEGKNMPMNALQGGEETNGDAYYIGRVSHQGTVTTGKVHNDSATLYIPFGGAEHAYSASYEVLIGNGERVPWEEDAEVIKKPVVVEVHPVPKDWRDAGLERHNTLRKRHGAPPMTLDPAINKMAQQTADYLANRRMMQHISKQLWGHTYGENLAMTSANHTAESATIDAIDRWYNEISYYNYNSPGFTMHTGHFTQVVWKNSTRLGLGYAKNGNYTIVVGQYDPPGNYTNMFRENVTPN